MSEALIEDPLSLHTARLSISRGDSERDHVRDMLRLEISSRGGDDSLSRRGSVVLFGSISEDLKEPVNFATDGSVGAVSAPKRNKRRRSSAAQAALPPPPPKKEKVHKRKKKKAQPPRFLVVGSDERRRLPFRMLRNIVLLAFGSPVNTTKGDHQWYDLVNPGNVASVILCVVPGFDPSMFAVQPSASRFKRLVKMGESTESLETPEEPAVADSPEEKDGGDESKEQDEKEEDKGQKQEPEEELLKQTDASLQFFPNTFNHIMATSGPGSKDLIYSPISGFLNIPLSKREKENLIKKLAKEKIVITDLLLTGEQLAKHLYPMVLPADASGWVETVPFEHPGLTIFALDCEMCLSGTEKVLTRVSLVNFDGEVVLDELVKPELPITDYVTKYLGISEELLEGVTTTLADIQKRLCETILALDVLIGHSLEGDLKVLQLKHTNIVDTALCFEHPRGPPAKPSLKWLASLFLQRQIQTGESTGAGHSLIEDATACLDLVKAKIANGRLFGVNVNEVLVFQRLASTDPLFALLLLGYAYYQNQELTTPADYQLTQKYVVNDDEVVSLYRENKADKRFVVANLRELEFARGWAAPPPQYTGETGASVSDAAARTAERLQQIYDAAPECSMMIIYLTLNLPRPLYALQAVRRNWQRVDRDGGDLNLLPEDERWTPQRDRELMDEAMKARESVSFITIKPLTA